MCVDESCMMYDGMYDEMYYDVRCIMKPDETK